MLVCIPWASKNFPRCLDHLKSKPLGSYTTPKYQKAISLLETISFSSNNSNLTRKMATDLGQITTARELLFEKEELLLYKSFFEILVSLPARGPQLGAHSDFEGKNSQI